MKNNELILMNRSRKSYLITSIRNKFYIHGRNHLYEHDSPDLIRLIMKLRHLGFRETKLRYLGFREKEEALAVSLNFNSNEYM